MTKSENKICTVPTWGKKYDFGRVRGGGIEYDFWGKYIPLYKRLKLLSVTLC